GDGAPHPWHSPKFIFLAKHRPALAETKGRGRMSCTCQSLRGQSRRYGLGGVGFADRSSMSERRTRPENIGVASGSTIGMKRGEKPQLLKTTPSLIARNFLGLHIYFRVGASFLSLDSH